MSRVRAYKGKEQGTRQSDNNKTRMAVHRESRIQGMARYGRGHLQTCFDIQQALTKEPHYCAVTQSAACCMTIIYHTALHCAVLYLTLLYSTGLDWTGLHCTMCTVQYLPARPHAAVVVHLSFEEPHRRVVASSKGHHLPRPRRTGGLPPTLRLPQGLADVRPQSQAGLHLCTQMGRRE